MKRWTGVSSRRGCAVRMTLTLVDTAGMRRKSRVSEDLEFYSVMRSIRAIEHSDVVILMIDATLGWESQDMKPIVTGKQIGRAHV